MLIIYPNTLVRMVICFMIRSNSLGANTILIRSIFNYFLKVGINKITKEPITPSSAMIILTGIIFIKI